jgi:hypothetical protein
MYVFFFSPFLQGLSAKPMTIKTALFRIIFVWLFALAWTLMPMFGWNRYASELSVRCSSYEIEEIFDSIIITNKIKKLLSHVVSIMIGG